MVKKIEEKTKIPKEDLKNIKVELLDYAKERIDIEVENSFKKIEKKIVRRKNIKIIKRDILLIILLALIVFLTYNLYDLGFFNKYLIKETEETNSTLEVIKTDSTIEEDIIKEDLKEKYKTALDNITISTNSKYLDDYYKGNLTNELKLYLTFNLVDTTNIVIDDDTYVINNDTIESYYNSLFNTSYNPCSFDYNNINIKYLKSQEIYLLDNEIKKSKSKIKRLITNVLENDKTITINTIEYLVNDNKVINILSKEEVADFKDEESIINNKDKLSTMEYTLIKDKDNYIIVNIESK